MENYYMVRFVRKDGKPPEEYWYFSFPHALFHFDLFIEDDSGIYERIELLNYSDGEKLAAAHLFI